MKLPTRALNGTDYMLNTDETILNILLTAKNKGNQLLKHFKISYPDKALAEENNCILVAVVSAENNLTGFDSQTFKDLVEILIITKQKDNRKAIRIIKTVSNEICRLIMDNIDQFPNKPVIRNINPFFDVDLILNRGQVMVQCNTEPVDFSNTDEDIRHICELLADETDIILK